MKQQLKSSIQKAANALGVGVHRGPSATFDPVVVDRFMLSAWFKRSARRELYDEALCSTGMAWSDNFPKQCRYDLLVQLLQHVIDRNVPGDLVECGCWKGHSSRMLSKTLAAAVAGGAPPRRFFIFDSFEGGLSDKVDVDRNERFDLTPEQIAAEKAGFGSTEADVRRATEGHDFVSLHKGWIPARFPDFGDRTCAFLHIDVDLYAPIRDTLRWFWPRLSPGAVIVLDDHGYTQFPGAKKAADEFFAEHTPSLFLEMPIGGAFAIK